LSETILTNAYVVGPDYVMRGTVVLRDGLIAAVDEGTTAVKAALDFGGDYLIPGLIDIHADALERHIAPRLGVIATDPLAALVAHDCQIASYGITTILNALAVGWFSPDDTTRRVLDKTLEVLPFAMDQGLLRAEHFLHIRCEIPAPDAIAGLEQVIRNDRVLLVSLMDHTPGQRQWKDVAAYRRAYGDKNWTDAEFGEHLKKRRESRAAFAAQNRRAIICIANEHGYRLASHDDSNSEHVAEAVADRIRISEFPTSREAATAARHHGMKTVMGAPNAVRGASHAGNASTRRLAAERLVDGLASDFDPYSLVHAPFVLHYEEGIPIAESIAMVTKNIAEMVGLSADRGAIDIGLRADVVRVRLANTVPVVRAVWRGGERVS
jgi:alpha-D-ribose 1-methylphosphonate 5-triphosphate diphosphatase